MTNSGINIVESNFSSATVPLLHKERTETVAETAKKGETVRAHATLLAETQCVCVCVCACVCVVVAGCGECGGDSGE